MVLASGIAATPILTDTAKLANSSTCDEKGAMVVRFSRSAVNV
jgi:hypothetical protein